jgi:hypothetical protein
MAAALVSTPAPAAAQSFLRDYDFYEPRPVFRSRSVNRFGIMDSHFHGILFPEVYKNLVSTRANYPGLWSAESNTGAFGIVPDQLTKYGWSGVYGWADADLDPGTAGLWLGNLNFERSDMDVYDGHFWTHSLQAKIFSLGGAFWGTPPNDAVFRGLSVVFDIDNVYAYDGNVNSEHLERRRFFINLTALIRLSENYSLRAGINTYNLQAEDPFSFRVDNNRLYTDGIFVGLIDRDLRTLDFWAENSFALNNGDEKSDTVSLGLRYARGWALSYMTHILFLGFKAGAEASYISEIGEETGSFQYMYYLKNLTDERRSVSMSAAMPVILDLNIYRSIRCVISAVPQIIFRHINTGEPQHIFTLKISEPEISLRGGVGDKFDFVMKPTLDNEIFIAGLEVRYRF